MKPLFGDRRWVVEWCTKYAIDENGDHDYDGDKHSRRSFGTREEALIFIRKIFPDSKDGIVTADLYEFQAFDEEDAERGIGSWEAIEESQSFFYDGGGMKLHDVSHVDHGIGQEIIEYLLGIFADREAFFIETIDLPESLGTVPCGLYGPIMGDDPVPTDRTFTAMRGQRRYTSRLIDLPPRQSRQVTVIAGPHQDESCVLYTAFGGPLAPREPGDPTISDDKQFAESVEFWSKHALSSHI